MAPAKQIGANTLIGDPTALCSWPIGSCRSLVKWSTMAIAVEANEC